MAGAEAIGFPIFVKAVAGGGGRGMRRVQDPTQLRESVSAAMREAEVRSVIRLSSSSRLSADLVTSRCKSLPTLRATPCTSSSATALYNGVTRR